MYVGFFFYYHGNYSLRCKAFIVVEICFLSQLSHGNFKTDSQTQIPIFKRNPKDKTKTQKKQNHRNKTETHQPPHFPQKNLTTQNPQHTDTCTTHTQRQNYSGWKGLQEGEA